jgi:TP901 family phage tail tape measure protein
MADDILKVGIDASGAVDGATKAKQALGGMVSEAKKTEDQLKKTGKTVGETGGALKKFGITGRDVVGVLGGLGIATTAAAAIMQLRQALINSTHAALDFSKAMAEVSTLLPDTSELGDLGDEVRRLSVEFNQSPTDQARALYQVISAGARDAAEAVQLLEVANRLAVGGVTDVATAADGLTSVLNAYGMSASEAGNVSDALFVAMRAGKTTIGELSSNLGQVAPLAAQAGVSIDELAAATAALTKGGISTSETITGLRAIITAVVSPSAEAARMARELGIEFNTAALQAKGLAGFMDEVVAASGGSADVMAQLFGNVRALVPALALAGQAGTDLNDILAQMEDKTGATGEAFDRVAESDAFRLEAAMGRLKDASIDIGNAILTGLLPPLEALAASIDEVGLATKTLYNLSRLRGDLVFKDVRAYIAANREAADSVEDVGEAVIQLPPAYEEWKAAQDRVKAAADAAAAAAAAAAAKAREAAEAQEFSEALRFVDELLAAREVYLRHEQDTILVLIEQRDLMAEIAANEKRSLSDRIAARQRELELAEAVANATAGGTGAMQFQPGTVPTLGTEPVTANLTPLNQELDSLSLTFDDVLGAVSPLLGGFASMADALGLLDARTSQAIRGISDIATGLQNIGSGNVLGGGLQVFGGVVSALAGIMGGDNEAERRHAAMIQARAAEEFQSAVREFASAVRGGPMGATPDLFQATDSPYAQDFFRQKADELGVTLAEAMELYGRELVEQAQKFLADIGDGFEEWAAQVGDDNVLVDFFRQIKDMTDAYREELDVRLLLAQGMDEEAARRRMEIDQRREMEEALAAGWDEATIALLAQIHAAEEAALATEQLNREMERQAEILATRQAFDTDIEVRRVKLGGDDREYIEASMRARGDAEIAAAQKLVEAGVLTEEQFLSLVSVINDEVIAALADFDEAAAETAARLAEAAAKARSGFEADVLIREAELSGNAIEALRVRLELSAKDEIDRARELLAAGTITQEWFDRFVVVVGEELTQAMADATLAAEELARAEAFAAAQAMDNLRVRLLNAQGLTEEAQALRDRMEIQAAIEAGRSAEYIMLLRQVQAEEARARALQEEEAAVKATTERIKEVSQALNAPTGLNLSLLRWRAAMPKNRMWDQGGALGQPVSDSGRFIGGSTVNNTQTSTTTMQLSSGAIQITVPKGTDGATLVQQIAAELERIAMAGGENPLVNLSTGPSS